MAASYDCGPVLAVENTHAGFSWFIFKAQRHDKQIFIRPKTFGLLKIQTMFGLIGSAFGGIVLNLHIRMV